MVSGAAAARSEGGVNSFCLSVTDKRRDEDYDEQVEETLQDEVKDPRRPLNTLGCSPQRD